MNQKHMSGTEERKFLRHLKLFFKELAKAEKTGLRYAVVGGVALAAWSGELYKPMRSNGTMRDIDVVVFDDPCNCTKDIEKRLRLSDYQIPVAFSRAKSEKYRPHVQLFSQLKRTQKGYSIVFRGVEMPLSDKMCKLCLVNLVTSIGNAIPIRTFHPSVLLHRYLIRVGGLKEKDRKKVTAFARYCVKSVGVYGSMHDRADCRAFHEFARNVRERYPWYTRFLQAYNYVDHQVFNSLLSHRMIPRHVSRFLVNV